MAFRRRFLKYSLKHTRLVYAYKTPIKILPIHPASPSMQHSATHSLNINIYSVGTSKTYSGVKIHFRDSGQPPSTVADLVVLDSRINLILCTGSYYTDGTRYYKQSRSPSTILFLPLPRKPYSELGTTATIYTCIIYLYLYLRAREKLNFKSAQPL